MRAGGGPLRPKTAEALAAMAEAGLADAAAVGALAAAWRLQQDLSQLLKLAIADDADPEHEPKGFQAVLAARAAGAPRLPPPLRGRAARRGPRRRRVGRVSIALVPGADGRGA